MSILLHTFATENKKEESMKTATNAILSIIISIRLPKVAGSVMACAQV